MNDRERVAMFSETWIMLDAIFRLDVYLYFNLSLTVTKARKAWAIEQSDSLRLCNLYVGDKMSLFINLIAR
jgi:hypothetical protein